MLASESAGTVWPAMAESRPKAVSEGWLWGVVCCQGLNVNTGVWEAAQGLSHPAAKETLAVTPWSLDAQFWKWIVSVKLKHLILHVNTSST